MRFNTPTERHAYNLLRKGFSAVSAMQMANKQGGCVTLGRMKELQVIDFSFYCLYTNNNVAQADIAAQTNPTPTPVETHPVQAPEPKKSKVGRPNMFEKSKIDIENVLEYIDKNKRVVHHANGFRAVLKELYNFKASVQSVRNWLREFGFVYRIRVKEPLISSANREVRLSWATYMQQFSAAWWIAHAMFSDESNFPLRADWRIGKWTRGKFRVAKTQHGGGFMLYAVISGRHYLVKRVIPHSKEVIEMAVEIMKSVPSLQGFRQYGYFPELSEKERAKMTKGEIDAHRTGKPGRPQTRRELRTIPDELNLPRATRYQHFRCLAFMALADAEKVRTLHIITSFCRLFV